MPNEKKLELSFISQAIIYAVKMKSEGKLPDSWPSEEGQNMYWFLFGPQNCVSCVCLSEGGGWKRHKWSNYLRMRSLFGSISSRLWPSEAQPSSTTGCVISSPRPTPCARTFFREVGWRTFCPAFGVVIGPLVEQASKWSVVSAVIRNSF